MKLSLHLSEGKLSRLWAALVDRLILGHGTDMLPGPSSTRNSCPESTRVSVQRGTCPKASRTIKFFVSNVIIRRVKQGRPFGPIAWPRRATQMI